MDNELIERAKQWQWEKRACVPWNRTATQAIELVPALCDEVARVTDERDAWFSWAVELGKKVGCLASTFPDSNSHISDAIDRLISSRDLERMAITEYLNEIDGVRQVYRRIDLSNSEIEEAMFRESAAIETLRRAASGCEMNTNDEYKVQSPDALEVERLREDLARWESGETFSQHAAEIYENLRAQLAAVQAERDALEAAQAENARMREALAEVLRVHDAATSPDLHYHLCPQWRGVHGKCNCGADKAIETARAALEPRP